MNLLLDIPSPTFIVTTLSCCFPSKEFQDRNLQPDFIKHGEWPPKSKYIDEDVVVNHCDVAPRLVISKINSNLFHSIFFASRF